MDILFAIYLNLFLRILYNIIYYVELQWKHCICIFTLILLMFESCTQCAAVNTYNSLKSVPEHKLWKSSISYDTTVTRYGYFSGS